MVNNKEALVVLVAGRILRPVFSGQKAFEKVYALSFLYGQKHERKWNWRVKLHGKPGWSLKSWMCRLSDIWEKLSDGYVYSHG